MACGITSESVFCIQHYIATALILAGISTTRWSVNWKVKSQKGLFETCNGNTCYAHNEHLEIRRMIALGFCLSVLCDLLATVLCLLKGFLPNPIEEILSLVVCLTEIMGGDALTFGSSQFAYENFGHQQYPGYSFWLVFAAEVML